MPRHSLSTTPISEEPTRLITKLRELIRENRSEATFLLIIVAVFLAVFFMPVGTPRFDGAVLEGLYLVNWYAREHVILCLLPAFLIAGAIAVFISQGAVMKYLGPAASKTTAFGVAAVSGSVLAVCSCTVLPLFGGIYRRGAGLGPAIAFLYAGPAINILAIVITAKVLGAEIGLARAIGAVVFAVVVGGLMQLIYHREEMARSEAVSQSALVMPGEAAKPLGQVAVFFALLIGILVVANWAPATPEASQLWHFIYVWKWPLTSLLAGAVALLLIFRWHWSALWVGTVASLVTVLALALPQTPQLAFVARAPKTRWMKTPACRKVYPVSHGGQKSQSRQPSPITLRPEKC